MQCAWRWRIPPGRRCPLREQQAVRAFVTDKNKGDAEKAGALLTQLIPRVQLRKALPLGVLILLWALALIAAPVLCFAFGTKWLAPALLVCIICELCTAKAKRMRRLWDNRQPGTEGVSAALTAMFRVTLKSPVKAEPVKLGVMAVALVLLAATWFLPDSAPDGPEALAARVAEVAAGKATLAEVLPDVPAGTEGIQMLEQAMKSTAYGSDDEMLLAALMLLHHQNDPALKYTSFEYGLHTKYIPDALQQTVPVQVDNAEEIAALENLLSGAAKEDQIAALGRFVKQKQLPEGLLAAFGRAMKRTCTLEELLAQCGVVRQEGHDPVEFLRAGMGSVTLEEAEQMASAAQAERVLLLQAMASSFTQVDDVLTFIRMAKAQGVSAAECYPEGTLLTLDTSRWDAYTSPQAASLGKRDTFLVLRRREKEEPYTTIRLAEADETGFDGELPDGLYEDYDPDADLGAAQYTVWLETAVLDRMPAERIPQTLAACDALVFLDEWYFCDGYVRSSQGLARGAWQGKQSDSPTFGVCQEIAVYSAVTGEWLFNYKENVICSPAMLETELEEMSLEDWLPVDHYIAAPDDAWMAQAYADFLFSLERRNWLLVP